MSMSEAEMRRRRERIMVRGGPRSQRERGELAVYAAVLDNGGEITAQRDHTPKPKSWWRR
jgi:hypothetical protein